MNQRRRFQLIFVLLIFVSVIAAQGQPTEVVVRKPGVEANPSLALHSFNGPEEIEHLLRQTLIRCGWFQVRERGPADYLLQAVWQGDSSRGLLRVAVAVGGETMLDFTSEQAAPQRQAVYEAVDILLNRLFDVPGIASSRIAFVMGEGGRKEVYTMNFDGSQVRRITSNGSISTEPSWASGGSEMLFYTYYEPMQMSIMSVDLQRGRQRRIARFTGLNTGARMSPDNRYLAMCLSRDGAVNLYALHLQNNELRQLTRDSAVISSPVWSPEGQYICYVSDRAGRPHLYVMSADGSRATRLLTDYEEAVEPDWSPVSNQLAFATRLGGRYAIAVVDMDESSENRERRVIAEGGGDWESPSWAPDGRHLVCVRTVGGQRQLVMVDSWLGTVIEITRPGKLELPDWSCLNSPRR